MKRIIIFDVNVTFNPAGNCKFEDRPVILYQSEPEYVRLI